MNKYIINNNINEIIDYLHEILSYLIKTNFHLIFRRVNMHHKIIFVKLDKLILLREFVLDEKIRNVIFEEWMTPDEDKLEIMNLINYMYYIYFDNDCIITFFYSNIKIIDYDILNRNTLIYFFYKTFKNSNQDELILYLSLLLLSKKMYEKELYDIMYEISKKIFRENKYDNEMITVIKNILKYTLDPLDKYNKNDIKKIYELKDCENIISNNTQIHENNKTIISKNNDTQTHENNNNFFENTLWSSIDTGY